MEAFALALMFVVLLLIYFMDKNRFSDDEKMTFGICWTIFIVIVGICFVTENDSEKREREARELSVQIQSEPTEFNQNINIGK